MIRLLAAIVLSVLAASVHSQTTLPYTFSSTAPVRGAPLQADLNVLVTAINNLAGRVSKLEGTITEADLVGNYTFDGFQTELATDHVSNYVYHGTATLAANHDLTLSTPENGTQLNFGTSNTTAVINRPAGPTEEFLATWSFSGGVLTVDGHPGALAVVAGGRLLVGVTSNPLDGTQVLLLLTRKN